MIDIYREALSWLGMGGIAVIPLQPGGKSPLVSWQQYQHRLPTDSEVMRWFNQVPAPNLGVVCGWHGLTVIDFDSPEWYEAWMSWASFDLASTYKVKTARGYHAYFFLGEPVRTKPLKFMGEHVIDIKGEGGYVLAPPSVHPSGHIYTALGSASIHYVPGGIETVLPPAWIDLLLEPEPSTTPIEPAIVDAWAIAGSAAGPVGISVEDVKRRIPLTRLLTGEMRHSGQGYYLTNCPLHDDANPSMWVNLIEGLCGCYAGCTDKPLDVINLYARMHNVTNQEAIRTLASWV